MGDTMFTDPLRERDLSDLGVDAVVNIAGGVPQRVILELDVDGLDQLIAGDPDVHVNCGSYDDSDIEVAVQEGHDTGVTEGWNAALKAVRKLAEESA